MKKIYSELSRIQQELKAPKNLYNSFGKYSYRNAEGILESVKPLLNGLALIINDEPVCIGNRFYIKATVTITDGEESISAVAYAREDETKKGMDGCQVTGSCSSYARKYALNALLMIDDAKDSDDDSLSPKNPANKEKIEGKSAGEPFTRPTQTGKTDVSNVAKVPATNNVKEYIKGELKTMQEVFNIPDKEQMMMRFVAMRNSLIEAKLIEDVDSDHQTMEQARYMIDAMYKNFKPSGERAS